MSRSRVITTVVFLSVGVALGQGLTAGQPALPKAERDSLMVQLADKPDDAHLRDSLDAVWKKYRQLQAQYALDRDLCEQVTAYVKRAYNLLPTIVPNMKRPYDRKRNARWNRENRKKPVRRLDVFPSDEETDCSYTVPFELVAIRDAPIEWREVSDNDITYLLITPRASFGKSYLIELPHNTEWNYRITEMSLCAELQPFNGKVRGHTFDSLLKPLFLEGRYTVYNSGQLPYSVWQISALE